MLIFKHSLALEVTPGWSLDVVCSCEGASSLLSSLSDWVTKELLQSRLLILACSRSGSAWLLAHSHHGARCQLLLVIIASLLFFALHLELPAPGARKPLGQVFQRVCFKFLKGGKADSMFKHASVWKVESACVAQGPMPQVELSKTNSRHAWYLPASWGIRGWIVGDQAGAFQIMTFLNLQQQRKEIFQKHFYRLFSLTCMTVRHDNY